MSSPGSTDPVDVIAAALARLRGRRMPRSPWDGGPGTGPLWSHGDFHGGPHGGQHEGPHGGPHGGHHDGHFGGPQHGGRHGPPPWLAGARLGGPARLRLLDALAAASCPLSVGEIADAIGVDQPRASRLVQQSVELGLVRREADPDDARRTRVALTDEGAAILRRFRGDRRETIQSALAEFTDAERTELARLLAKLAEAWPRG